MQILHYILFVIYGISLVFILFNGFAQVHLVYSYLRSKRKKLSVPKIKEFPLVCVQLPVYNELYVVERLIDSMTKLNYPKDQLEIQILDDSNDESTEIIAKKVEKLQAENWQITHIQRKERSGFKAGALKYGLSLTQAQFVAIFDADFLPNPDFLIKTIPFFQNPKIAVVQSRWSHLNKNYSLLTKIQAFGLDAHFTVEQVGRSHTGAFINFNGTGGIWRVKAIKDAGGWQDDTLTEDLDLSYRAQLRGWKVQYLEELESPAELPMAMSALRSQQYRWTKGAAENARKNLWKVLHSKQKFVTKFHAIFHLLNSTLYLTALLIAILSFPLTYIVHEHEEYAFLFRYSQFFLTGFLMLGAVYFTALHIHKFSFFKRITHFLFYFPLFIIMGMGMSLHNAIAVLRGHFGKKSAFIRTPKFNMVGKSGSWKSNKYLKRKISNVAIFELILGIYFLSASIFDYMISAFMVTPFHFALSLGFFIIFGYSVKHWRSR